MTANECFTCGYPWVRAEHAEWCIEVDGKRVHAMNRYSHDYVEWPKCPICGGGTSHPGDHRRTKKHQAALR